MQTNIRWNFHLFSNRFIPKQGTHQRGTIVEEDTTLVDKWGFGSPGNCRNNNNKFKGAYYDVEINVPFDVRSPGLSLYFEYVALSEGVDAGAMRDSTEHD